MKTSTRIAASLVLALVALDRAPPASAQAAPWQLPEALRVNAVRGGEVCFEASPRINWQKTAQRYFKDFPPYRPDADRVRTVAMQGNGRAVFEYPAELPFPKRFQRYFALGTDSVHEVNAVRAVGTVTYRLDPETREVLGPWLSGIICGPAVQSAAARVFTPRAVAMPKTGALPEELFFVLATRPDMHIERLASLLGPNGRDGYELSLGEPKWRFYGDDLGGRTIERGFVVRAAPNGTAYYVAQLGPELPGASVRCRASWRIFELAAQPIPKAQQNYGCS